MIPLILLSVNEDTDFDSIKHLLPMLSPERQDKIRKYTLPRQKKLSLLAELLIRQELAREHHVSPADITLGYTKYGKPYWTEIPDCFFSVSYSQNRILFVQHDTAVGADLERLRPAKLNTARHFFAPAEYNAVMQSSNPDRTFFEIWTKKEAYVKMLGTGLNTPLTSFNIFEDELSRHFTTLSCDNFQIAVCCDKPSQPDLTHITDGQLLLHFS